MEQWLLRTPKLIVALVLGAFFAALMMFLDPPPTICSTQMDVFKESQGAFLYGRGTQRAPLPPEFEVEFEKCAKVASMGGCFELFDGMRRVVREVQPLRSECQVAAARSKELGGALRKSYTLMTHLAWGERVPASAERANWFEKSDIHLYCQLDRYLRLGRGDQGMAALQREIMETLPEAATVSSDEVWAKSIMSYNCRNI